MRIGIPKEIKTLEGRVAMIPSAAAELCRQGHSVTIERDAGIASGYQNAEYEQLGVTIVDNASALFDAAQLIVKVKEPLPAEYPLLREDHILFCYLHLATLPELATELQQKGLTAIAWETVEEGGKLPLLQPMSEVAGKLAVQLASNWLYRPNHGSGVLLGGLASSERGRVVILGAGSVGTNAALVASQLGAQVTVFERNRDRMLAIHSLAPNITALPSFSALIEKEIALADVVVGGILIPGGRTPVLVNDTMVRSMRPGSVIVDVAIDQGGCIETIRPTLWDEPIYQMHDVTHCGVTNLPGAVPRTSAQALSTALLPYVLRLAAADGLSDAAIQKGINVRDGQITHDAVRTALEGTP